METTILIAPFDGPYAAALAAEARAAGRRAALAVRGGPLDAPKFAEASRSEDGARGAEIQRETLEGHSQTIAWNPASFVSAGALLLGARNAFGEIDAAVIISDPRAEGAAGGRSDLLGGSPGGASSFIEEACLGPALLARELVRRFEARHGGRLLLLSVERETEAPLGPAPALVAGAFRGLGEGLFAASRGASWSAFGIADTSGSPEAAARFALRLLEDPKAGKAGRWLKFSGKSGIFGVF